MMQFVIFCIIEFVLIMVAGDNYDSGNVGSCISLALFCIIAAIIEAAYLICRIILLNRL